MIKGRLKRSKILLFISISFFLTPTHSSVQELELQALEYVQRQFQSELLESDHIDIEIQPLSRRLTLSPCRTDIEFSTRKPLQAGRFALKASCQKPKRWTLNIRGTIKVMREVVTSVRPLPRSTILSRQDVKLASMDIASLRNGYFTELKAINGYELKRSVPPNKALNPSQLLPPLLIQKDDQVIIHAGKSQLLSVRVAGVALDNGRKNEQIRIKNINSGKIIKARVIATGEVRAGR